MSLIISIVLAVILAMILLILLLRAVLLPYLRSGAVPVAVYLDAWEKILGLDRRKHPWRDSPARKRLPEGKIRLDTDAGRSVRHGEEGGLGDEVIVSLSEDDAARFSFREGQLMFAAFGGAQYDDSHQAHRMSANRARRLLNRTREQCGLEPYEAGEDSGAIERTALDAKREEGLQRREEVRRKTARLSGVDLDEEDAPKKRGKKTKGKRHDDE